MLKLACKHVHNENPKMLSQNFTSFAIITQKSNLLHISLSKRLLFPVERYLHSCELATKKSLNT